MFFRIIFIVAGKCTIKKSMMMKSYSTWGPSFKVSFSLKINKLPRIIDGKIYTNIIHFTNGENCCKSGERIPAVYIKRVGFGRWRWWRRNLKLTFISDINGRGNFWFDFPNGRNVLALGKQYDITIQQSQIGGRYMYQVFVSGKRVINVVNRSPKTFNNVKLYTSDPWYQAFTSDLGTVSKLKIENQ